MKPLIRIALLLAVAALAALGGASVARAAAPTPPAPTVHVQVCDFVTGSVTTPPSYTVARWHGVRWQVSVNGAAAAQVPPGTHYVTAANINTVVIAAVRGHKQLARWMFTLVYGGCASINPPPTHHDWSTSPPPPVFPGP